MFEAERLRIQQKLGHLVREIHHVGSTAVPGMKAKPEIDLLIVVNSTSEIEAINSGMAELGYDVRGVCGIEWRHYYSKNTRSVRTHKAHACEISHSNVVRQIAFRDYMRDHHKDAQEYAELKLRLAVSNSKRNGRVPGRQKRLHRRNSPGGSSPRIWETACLTKGLEKDLWTRSRGSRAAASQPSR
jgi:GrpB-like predicted nucleotidyltransferase (UPF0157 family)